MRPNNTVEVIDIYDAGFKLYTIWRQVDTQALFAVEKNKMAFDVGDTLDLRMDTLRTFDAKPVLSVQQYFEEGNIKYVGK